MPIKNQSVKKIVLVSVILLAVMTSHSQTEKGRRFIGGTFNLGKSSDSDSNTDNEYDTDLFTFRIAPEFGYFVTDNLAIGVNADYYISNRSHNHMSVIQPGYRWSEKYGEMGYGAGGFVRYYKKITDNFFFTLNGRISCIHSIQKREYTSSDPLSNYSNSYKNGANVMGVSVAPGLVYFVTPKLGIQSSFGAVYYNYTGSKTTSSTITNYQGKGKRNDYGINLNPSTFFMGLNYYF